MFNECLHDGSIFGHITGDNTSYINIIERRLRKTNILPSRVEH